MKKHLIAALLLGLGLVPTLSNVSNAFEPSDLEKLKTTRSCEKCDLSGANLSGMNLERANLSGANLSNADLSNAKFIFSDLRNVKFDGAKTQNTNVFMSQFERSALTEIQRKGLISKNPKPPTAQQRFQQKHPFHSPYATNSISSSFIFLLNEGGYDVNYTLIYNLYQPVGGINVITPIIKSGYLRFGTSERLFIDAGAKNIIFKVQPVTRGDLVIDYTKPDNSAGTCFKIYGTVFSPQSFEWRESTDTPKGVPACWF